MTTRAVLVTSNTDDPTLLDASLQEALNPMLPECGGDEIIDWEFVEKRKLGSKHVHVGEEEKKGDMHRFVQITDYEGEEVVYWDEEEWKAEPPLVLTIIRAVKVAIRRGPEAVKKELGAPQEAPGSWEGTIWFAEPDHPRATFRWLNPDPEDENHDALEIEMYTDPGEAWSVAFFEETEDEEGNVSDGIAQQPRPEGQKINPGIGRSFVGAMQYVEDLMRAHP
jgi:hypothetical protein